MNRSDLKNAIVKSSYLTGDFLLRSGARSTEYFDKYQFEAAPNILKVIARELAALIPRDTEVLAGLELGGVPIATALSLETGIPTAFVRKKAKEYGTLRIAEGAAVEGRRVCIIEDVITTGGQVVQSAKELEQGGAAIEGVLCVILRAKGENLVSTQGWNLRSLFTMEELLGRS